MTTGGTAGGAGHRSQGAAAPSAKLPRLPPCWRRPWHLLQCLDRLNHLPVVGRSTLASLGSLKLKYKMWLQFQHQNQIDAGACHSADKALDHNVAVGAAETTRRRRWSLIQHPHLGRLPSSPAFARHLFYSCRHFNDSVCQSGYLRPISDPKQAQLHA